MITSPMNALMNANNPAQGQFKKVLCVCSAGMLRSPTLAAALSKNLGFNTRAAGSVDSFALIPVSTALLRWADMIVFMNPENFRDIVKGAGAEGLLKGLGTKIKVLDIPDNFCFNDPELIEECLQQWYQTAEFTLSDK